MITVDEALQRIFALADALPTESVPLIRAAGRTLAEPAVAKRDQPPFPSSAMDGYAVADAAPGETFRVVGESAAGHRFESPIRQGEAVRIFTGAPVPDGADRVIIQEDVTREDDKITLNDNLDSQEYIRPASGDFSAGDAVPAPRVLGPNDIALLAAMNIADVTVTCKPVVALIATGDELVMPGETPGPDQIIASNSLGLAALINGNGGHARVLPIARDNAESLKTAFALAEGADLMVTIGGASVGDHDLVAPVAEELGMARAFYKVAMRPGKPLMAGKIGGAAMIGLPGNPVSSMVCGHVFVVPLLRKMLGLGAAPSQRMTARLGRDIGANGPREHYMRATVNDGEIIPFERQDSSLLSILTKANALLVRPTDAKAGKTGDDVEYLPIGLPPFNLARHPRAWGFWHNLRGIVG